MTTSSLIQNWFDDGPTRVRSELLDSGFVRPEKAELILSCAEIANSRAGEFEGSTIGRDWRRLSIDLYSKLSDRPSRFSEMAARSRIISAYGHINGDKYQDYSIIMNWFLECVTVAFIAILGELRFDRSQEVNFSEERLSLVRDLRSLKNAINLLRPLQSIDELRDLVKEWDMIAPQLP
jgi:hypothetical protein